MSLRLIIFFLPLVALPSTGSLQEWTEADIRGLEFAPSPPGQPSPCARLWIEERTWRFISTPEGLTGTYGNVVRTHPLGATLSSCRFSSRPEIPMAFSARSWKIASSSRDSVAWSVRAEPMGSMGDQLELRAEAFTTKLWDMNDRLIDSSTAPSDTNHLEFRRPGPPPKDLRLAAQAILEGLSSGECTRILSGSVDMQQPREQSGAMVAAMCDIRRRVSDLAGHFVAISMGDIFNIDRVAAAIVQAPDAKGWYARSAYLVDYTTNYERQAVPGNALFVRDGDKWRLAHLWF